MTPTALTLKDAIAFTIDYGKFIATVWAAYIGLITAIIGWLLTLRGGKGLDPLGSWTLITAFLVVSGMFWGVIHLNDSRLIGLMEVVDQLAKIEADKMTQLKDVYARVFTSTDIAARLRQTEWLFLPIAAALASGLMFVLMLKPAPDAPGDVPNKKAEPA